MCCPDRARCLWCVVQQFGFLFVVPVRVSLPALHWQFFPGATLTFIIFPTPRQQSSLHRHHHTNNYFPAPHQLFIFSAPRQTFLFFSSTAPTIVIFRHHHANDYFPNTTLIIFFEHHSNNHSFAFRHHDDIYFAGTTQQPLFSRHQANEYFLGTTPTTIFLTPR